MSMPSRRKGDLGRGILRGRHRGSFLEQFVTRLMLEVDIVDAGLTLFPESLSPRPISRVETYSLTQHSRHRMNIQNRKQMFSECRERHLTPCHIN